MIQTAFPTFLAATLLVPSGVAAWEFTASPVCTLSHASETVEIVLTHDPGIPEYALELTLTDGEWASAEQFGMGFTGGFELTIGTSRHQTDGARLRVADSGFGNVLDGLEFAAFATAFTEHLSVPLPLDGIGEPMQAFRACPTTAPATS